MWIAARGLGVGSIVVGVVVAVALLIAWYPGPPEKLTGVVGKCDCWNGTVDGDPWAPTPGPSIVARKPGSPVGTCTPYGLGSRTQVVTVETLFVEADHCLEPHEKASVDFSVTDDGGI